MERETKRDIIFNIIKKYHQENGKLDSFEINEHLISKGFDLSKEVLEERIEHFKNETSETNKEKDKSF